MPTGGLIINDPGATGAHEFCLFVAALDVAKQPGSGTLFGTNIDSVVINEKLGEGDTLEFVIDDPLFALTIHRGDDVYMCDHAGRSTAAGLRVTDDLFRGFVDDATSEPDGLGQRWHVRALSLDALLDRRRLIAGTIGGLQPSGSYLQTDAAIQQLLSTLDPRVSALATDPGAITVNRAISPNLIVSIGVILAPVPLAGLTYRKAFEALLAASSLGQVTTNSDIQSIVLDVDVQGRARSNPRVATVPLSTIREGIGAPATAPAPYEIDARLDRSAYVSRVYVQGVDAVSSGWVVDSNEASFGRTEEYISAPFAIDATSRDAAGAAFLNQHRAVYRLGFSLSDTHDRLVPLIALDSFGGWHARGKCTATSDSGYWPTPSEALDHPSTYIWEMTRTFSGGGLHSELQLVIGGGRQSGASAIAQRFSAADTATKSAGRLVGSLDEVAVRSKAGVPTDADFDIPRDGFTVLDTTDGTVFVRMGGVWKATSTFRYVSTGLTLELSAAGVVVLTEVQLSALPVSDPNVLYAVLIPRVFDNTGAAGTAGASDNWLGLYHDDDSSQAGVTYNSGIFSRGGVGGPTLVRVGGSNARSVLWRTSVAGGAATVSLWSVGYWSRAL